MEFWLADFSGIVWSTSQCFNDFAVSVQSKNVNPCVLHRLLIEHGKLPSNSRPK
jgi:hypothetical protein